MEAQVDEAAMEEGEELEALEVWAAQAVRFCYLAARSSRGAVGAGAEEVMVELEQVATEA